VGEGESLRPRNIKIDSFKNLYGVRIATSEDILTLAVPIYFWPFRVENRSLVDVYFIIYCTIFGFS
jgi:hypothetical protein